MGEVVGRLFFGAGANPNAGRKPLLSFRLPGRAANQQTKFVFVE
jgi:hypothetical protein